MSYEKLVHHFRRISQFEELGAIVNWDQAVNMPDAAGPRRAEAMAGLSRLIHDLVAEERLQDWLDTAQSEPQLGDWERANLAEMSRKHMRARALPADLVEATAQACNISEQAWRRYRAENDFTSYVPHLKSVIDHKRQCAAALGEKLGLSPYDALMDEFEPGLNAATVDRALSAVRTFLPGYIDEVIERQKNELTITPLGPFPIEQQRKLALRMMQVSGLNMKMARIDESHHPFCGGVPTDVRITNRYREDEFLPGLMGVLHESGHGKYEQGLPEPYQSQPVGTALGMVVHESQSLLQEMQVSRGQAFITFLSSVIPSYFPERYAQQPEAYEVKNLVRLQTRVKRGLIRVDADEVSYPAHVMLRYDLEQDLIAGRLQASQLPDAWDAKMQHYLGLRTLGNDRDGCLQDVHWPIGAFGYFPMYTLGAMMAAQLFAAVELWLPEIQLQIANGNLEPLNDWLKNAVWSKGRSQTLEQILTSATGQPLSSDFFIQHLRVRYG